MKICVTLFLVSIRPNRQCSAHYSSFADDFYSDLWAIYLAYYLPIYLVIHICELKIISFQDRILHYSRRNIEY